MHTTHAFYATARGKTALVVPTEHPGAVFVVLITHASGDATTHPVHIAQTVAEGITMAQDFLTEGSVCTN